MVKLIRSGVYLTNADTLTPDTDDGRAKLTAMGLCTDKEKGTKQTMAYSILKSHNVGSDMDNLRIKFDAMASHDITYVGIVQTARASGLEKFPIPYVLTNCHNSLCAVGGTINEDDHLFGLSAAKKYGGIYVPAHQAVIHAYMREMHSACGSMILGSDSHTRYGALGTLAIGEGGGELAKQLLGKTYDVKAPEVVAVVLEGAPKPGVGPQDVALAIIGAVFESGFVKNKVLEFVGGGIANLDMEYRNGIDVMTTETTCLSSIWCTDEKTKAYFENHGRPQSYKALSPGNIAYYSGAVVVSLDKIKPMIAMPFHPSNVYTIEELNQNLDEIVHATEEKAKAQLGKHTRLGLAQRITKKGLLSNQGFIGGCAGGTFDNIIAATDILGRGSIGNDEFSLSVYPQSQPVNMGLIQAGAVVKLINAGATVRTAFCGPCFGAGDVPSNQGLSVRHSTRNFPSREGSKPGDGQIASVALMDARSIAATALNGGIITSAADLDIDYTKPAYSFNKDVYTKRCYNGYGAPKPETELKLGPNITDWPKMSPLTEHLLLKVASYITDDVTTTDELIPSGETSSYRSNPLRLAEFTLSRRDPEYVSRAKAVQVYEKARLAGEPIADSKMTSLFASVTELCAGATQMNTGIGSVVYARKPGDGSAREQAASCQKVLGGWANIATEYATKRYRSNLINWGMLPLTIDNEPDLAPEDYIFIPGIRSKIAAGESTAEAYVLGDGVTKLTLNLPVVTDDERDIMLSGCLINYYKG